MSRKLLSNPMGMTKHYKGYEIKFLHSPHIYEIFKNGHYCAAKPTFTMTMQYIDEVEMKRHKQYKDNPPRQDDLSRALNTINHTFNMVGKHVTVGGEGQQYNVYVTDTFSDDIIRTWGPISKDAATYIITGMLETIKIVRYE